MGARPLLMTGEGSSARPSRETTSLSRALRLSAATGTTAVACWWAFAEALPSLQPYYGWLLAALVLFWTTGCGRVFAHGLIERSIATGAPLAGAFLGLLSDSPSLFAGFSLLAGLLMLGALMIWIGGMRAAGAQARSGPLAYAFAMLASSAALLLTGGGLQALISPVPARALAPSRQVERLYHVDQADRLSGVIVLDSSRDRRRLARIQELDEARQLGSATAKYQASVIYIHGGCPAHFKRAAELARMAAAEGLVEAAGLARAAEDRWLLALGKPQRHGTQMLHLGGKGC